VVPHAGPGGGEAPNVLAGGRERHKGVALPTAHHLGTGVGRWSPGDHCRQRTDQSPPGLGRLPRSSYRLCSPTDLRGEVCRRYPARSAAMSEPMPAVASVRSAPPGASKPLHPGCPRKRLLWSINQPPHPVLNRYLSANITMLRALLPTFGAARSTRYFARCSLIPTAPPGTTACRSGRTPARAPCPPGRR
jgi:hypothetical protein